LIFNARSTRRIPLKIITEPEPEYLAHVSRLTHLRTKMPQMLSGHVQGRFLSLMSHLVKPNRVLEIGTFTGYSAICLAEGLADGGQVVTVDNDEERALWVNPLIAQSPYGNKIQPVIEPAVSFLSHIPDEPWDLVFIDADKLEYPKYLELIAPHIRSGRNVIGG
jgi:predicted O-methyltransferase YrrM